MARQSAISREAREYIIDEIERRGLIELDEVVTLVTNHYQFDPLKAKDREIKSWARRLLGSLKAQDGSRQVLAVKGQPGLFANIATCEDGRILKAIDEQVSEKWLGLGRTLRNVKRRRREVDGQQSLYAVDAI